MSVNWYNGRFVITAKSLETNVAVVTRVDCISNPCKNTWWKHDLILVYMIKNLPCTVKGYMTWAEMR
jgi:hypothetical protein